MPAGILQQLALLQLEVPLEGLLACLPFLEEPKTVESQGAHDVLLLGGSGAGRVDAGGRSARVDVDHAALREVLDELGSGGVRAGRGAAAQHVTQGDVVAVEHGAAAGEQLLGGQAGVVRLDAVVGLADARGVLAQAGVDLLLDGLGVRGDGARRGDGDDGVAVGALRAAGAGQHDQGGDGRGEDHRAGELVHGVASFCERLRELGFGACTTDYSAVPP